MNISNELNELRKQLIDEINTQFDAFQQKLSDSGFLEILEDHQLSTLYEPSYETPYALNINNLGIFKGKKPTGIIFNNSERMNHGTWRSVFESIIKHCDQQKHDELRKLSGKISGRSRIILADTSEKMHAPLEVAPDLYVETHYDTETLLKILITKILIPVQYDYTSITVLVRLD